MHITRLSRESLGSAVMRDDKVVELENVTWSYPRIDNRTGTFKHQFVNMFNRKERLIEERKRCLNQIDLEISKGECVGVIGSNGAGKSTLLRVIAGVLKPETGRVAVSGQVTPIMDLGATLNGQLTCKDNAILSLYAFGWTKKQVSEKLIEVFDWCEMREYMNEPFSVLSSGMSSRLLFSISTIQNPDIVLIDEVLSVGDKSFRDKANSRIENFVKHGSVAVIVSHDLSVIERMTNKCLWLEDGGIKMLSDSTTVLEAYSKVP